VSLTDHLAGVREVMHLVFGIPPEQIGPTTSQPDVPEWDSVGHLNLMLGLEGRFGVTLDVSDLTRLTSVAAIVDYLNEACPST
jgi:acyl carrier protein